MQKTRFQLRKPRGKKKKKKNEKQEEIILEGAPLQYVREYSSPLIRIVGECNAW
jgi:transposase